MFKIIHKILGHKKVLLISVPDFYEYSKKLLETKKIHYKKIYNIEKKIFTSTDITGLFYNKTIWTFERLERCLTKAGFNNIKEDTRNRNKYNISLIAIK